MENTKIRVENFKIGKNTTSEINSGVVILIFGIVLISVPLLQFRIFFSELEDTTYQVFTGVDQILLVMLLTIASTAESYLTFAAAGWAVGGFVAALLYGNEGKNGPLYASYIIFRLFLGIIFFSVILLALGISEFDLPEFAIAFLEVLIILIISLPMVIVAGISYRVGLWLSPKSL